MTTSGRSDIATQRRLWAALPYVPVLLLLPFVLAAPANCDVAALLDFTQRWADGEALYSRLIDVNPPLIFLINRLPIAVAQLTGMDAVTAFDICVIALGALSWWLCLDVRRREAEGAVQRSFLDVVPVLVLVGAGSDFGQREHLMVLGTMPYLFAAAARADNRRPPHQDRFKQVFIQVLAAALAAIMLALKPHFLAIPALVEIYVLSAVGWHAWLRDPGPWIMAALFALYLAAILLLFPDYLGVVLPLAWMSYRAMSLPPEQLVVAPQVAATLIAVLPLLAIAGLGRDKLAKVVGLAVIAALGIYLAQGKGWSYHLVPFALLTCILAGNVAARLIDAQKASPQAFMASMPHLVALAFVGVMLGYLNYWDNVVANKLAYPASADAALPAVLEQTGATRALVLSPDVWPIYPALNYAHMRSTMRAISLWMVQGAYMQCLPGNEPYRAVGDMGRAERFAFETVAEDFAAAPPGLLVVDREPGIFPRCSDEFDIVAYFSRHPRFAATWPRYRFVALCGRLAIYQRADQAGPAAGELGD